MFSYGTTDEMQSNEIYENDHKKMIDVIKDQNMIESRVLSILSSGEFCLFLCNIDVYLTCDRNDILILSV